MTAKETMYTIRFQRACQALLWVLVVHGAIWVMNGCASDTGDELPKLNIVNPEAFAKLDTSDPAFIAWAWEHNGGFGWDKDESVGGLQQNIGGNTNLCTNNNISGGVTTSTALGKGMAACAAAMWPTGYYACSGNFSSGTCTLALGSGTSNTRVGGCAASSGYTVPYPGTTLSVYVANKCTTGTAGDVYAGTRYVGSAGYPSYVYQSFASGSYYAKTDVNASSALQYW